MAQTTAHLSFNTAYIAHSQDGSTWVDISGEANSIEISGGVRQTGAAYTADGDTALITRGKREPLTIVMRALYTEPASAILSSVYSEAQASYEAATDASSEYFIRWSPKGDNTDNLRFTSSTGVVKNPVYPVGDASTADPLMVEITVECASITEVYVA